MTARVGIGRLDNGRFSPKVDRAVALYGVDHAMADPLGRAAHEEICPYSRAMQGNIEVSVSVA